VHVDRARRPAPGGLTVDGPPGERPAGERVAPGASTWSLPLLAFAALTLFVTWHHEPWRDEADAWLVARDVSLTPLWRLLGSLVEQRLWYALLIPLAKLGAPYWTELLLNNVVVIGAVALLLTRSPFPPLLRVALAFSYYPAFEYGIIARSYGLLMLGAFALAAFYPSHRRHPVAYGLLLALVLNVNVHGFFIAGAMLGLVGLDLFRHRPLTLGRLVGPAIAAGGAALVYLQLMPPSSHEVTQALADDGDWWVLRKVLESVIVPAGLAPWTWLVTLGTAVNGLAVTAILALVLRSLRATLFCGASLPALTHVFVFGIYSGHRHAGIVMLVLMVALWIRLREHPLRRPDGEPRSARLLVPVQLALLLSCLFTARDGYREVTTAFSGAEEMARFILDNDLAHRPIAASQDPPCLAVLPYLPHETFWFAGIQDHGSHLVWLEDRPGQWGINVPKALARIEAAFDDTSDLLLLFNAPIPEPRARRFRLLYRTQREVFRHRSEQFHLYEFRGG